LQGLWRKARQEVDPSIWQMPALRSGKAAGKVEQRNGTGLVSYGTSLGSTKSHLVFASPLQQQDGLHSPLSLLAAVAVCCSDQQRHIQLPAFRLLHLLRHQTSLIQAFNVGKQAGYMSIY